jgi:hypothetical protein
MTAAFVSAGLGVGTLGFDNAATPPWVMVPQGGSKTVRLTRGDGLTLRLKRQIGTDLPTIQEKFSDPIFGRTIEIAGRSPSTSILEAFDASGRVNATLEINVKAKIVLATSVFFVFEQNGRACRAGLGTAEQMIEVANKLYLPQANIELKKRDSGPVKLPFNLNEGMPVQLKVFNVPPSFIRNTPGPLPCISSRPPDSRGCLPEVNQGALKTAEDLRQLRRYQVTCNILSNVKATSDYHIFFVRFVDDPLTRGFTPPKFNSDIAVNACLIPDSGTTGQVLAHELGHFMLRPGPSSFDRTGHSTTPGDLMVEHPGEKDIKIPKDQAIFMNPSGNGIFKF